MDKELIKNLNELVKKYNPIDNEVEFRGGTTLSWKLDPKVKLSKNPFEDIDKSKFDIKVEKDLSENVEINLRLKGNFTFEKESLSGKLEFRVKF